MVAGPRRGASGVLNREILGALALLLGLSACATAPDAPPGADDYRIYRGDGSVASLEELLAASRAADITFLGESHDDAVAHHLEETLLRAGPTEGLALSLEMFETDTQLVLDEYLRGLLSEERFREDARAWDNYEEAYRPLVEFAREQDIPVLAANAPRRYVNLVGREGAGALAELSEEALRFLPPLPLPPPSHAYREKFVRLMTQDMPAGSHGEAQDTAPGTPPGEEEAPTDASVEDVVPAWLESALQAQALWDASMAWSLARFLEEHPQARVLHVNGAFHSEGRLGIVEQLANYRPGARALVITVQPAEDFPAFAQDMEGLGDFVVVTDPDA